MRAIAFADDSVSVCASVCFCRTFDVLAWCWHQLFHYTLWRVRPLPCRVLFFCYFVHSCSTVGGGFKNSAGVLHHAQGLCVVVVWEACVAEGGEHIKVDLFV